MVDQIIIGFLVPCCDDVSVYGDARIGGGCVGIRCRTRNTAFAAGPLAGHFLFFRGLAHNPLAFTRGGGVSDNILDFFIEIHLALNADTDIAGAVGACQKRTDLILDIVFILFFNFHLEFRKGDLLGLGFILAGTGKFFH